MPQTPLPFPPSLSFSYLIPFFSSLLSFSSHPSHLPQIHALLLTSGLLDLTADPSAHHPFDKIPHPTLPLFNSLLKLHSHHKLFPQTLQLYSQMLKLHLGPSPSTLPPVLKACAALSNLNFGSSVHTHIVKLGFQSNTFIQNGLIVVYTSCGEMGLASSVFDGLKLEHRNLISWTSVVSGFVQNGYPLEALRVFRKMRLEFNATPDFIMLVSVVKAHGDIEDVEGGRCVHGLGVKLGLDDELDLVIALTSMYAKCGQVSVARLLFDKVRRPGLILWNAMISGYAKNGFADEAVALFKEMVSRNVRPDSITIRSAILACTQLGSLELGKWMEDFIGKSEYKNDIFVNTTLIDMYAKCGSIIDARRVFETIRGKDVVVWSAIIVSYGLHGCGREAIGLFHEMIRTGVRPNDVTFLGILSACNHAGLVEEGWKYFHLMKDYEVEPRHQHYACVVDLLARSGHLEKAYAFIVGMPMEPMVTVWGALLNACRIYGHVGLGKLAAERVFDIEPLNAGHYVQLSNIYASAGMWSDVARLRVLMKERGVGKEIACSSIEINRKLQSFQAGDESHPRSKEIFVMVDELEKRLRESGSVPRMGSDLHDLYVEEDEALCSQS